MPNLIILVGPPGSGKSSKADRLVNDDGDHGASTEYINQDTQGKTGHLKKFNEALFNLKDIIVDRMNFNKEQRSRYTVPAKAAGYTIKIIVLHESWETCMIRMSKRQNHPTITTEESAKSALHTFFTKYERPLPDEADTIVFNYPEGPKPKAIICDLDGTLCDMEHRRVHLDRQEGKKPNWRAFFSNMDKDIPNEWCVEILNALYSKYEIVFASGRPADYQTITGKWIFDNLPEIDSAYLFMRSAGDHRQDSIVKENILDFEILTRFIPYFVIDDRKQVVEMWRRRGLVCLQCDEGNF